MLQQIKDESLQARKERDTVRANLLSTVLSDIKLKAKDDGNREPTDKDAQKVIEKFLKQNQLALNARTTEQLERERKILLSYSTLEQACSDVDIDAVFAQVIAEHPEKWEAFKTNPKLAGFFAGQVMKVTHGKANPATVSQKLTEALNG